MCLCVILHDTVYVGVEDVEAVSIKLYQRGGSIVVEGAEGMGVRVYDAVGRMVAYTPQSFGQLPYDRGAANGGRNGQLSYGGGAANGGRNGQLSYGGGGWWLIPLSPSDSSPMIGEQLMEGEQVRIAVPVSGVYLVKVGDYPARRIVVIR